MDLNGTLALGVPPQVAAAGFQDGAVLGIFLPHQSTMTETAPGAFSFVVVKEAGVVTLRLPGTLTVAPSDAGLRFEARARHLLGGSVTLTLMLSFTPTDQGCTLRHDGTLESTGLAGRLLREREGQAQGVLDARFATVKAAIETAYRADLSPDSTPST